MGCSRDSTNYMLTTLIVFINIEKHMQILQHTCLIGGKLRCYLPNVSVMRVCHPSTALIPIAARFETGIYIYTHRIKWPTGMHLSPATTDYQQVFGKLYYMYVHIHICIAWSPTWPADQQESSWTTSHPVTLLVLRYMTPRRKYPYKASGCSTEMGRDSLLLPGWYVTNPDISVVLYTHTSSIVLSTYRSIIMST